jgi:glutathione reductase (NADPH)
MAYDFDLFVVGGGSGGVRCARIAAGHGAKVAIAESRFWGGTCVNVGCVPKKIMVQASEYGSLAQDSHGFGWDTQRGTHDWAALIAHKDAEIGRLNSIYVRLLETAGVQMFEAHACFAGPHSLKLGDQVVTAERIVIATGGHPVRPSIPGADLGIVSDAAFHLKDMPRRVTMVGGGYISVEFAGIFAGLGAEVDLVMRQPLPLRGFDEDLRGALAEALTASGIRLHASCVPTMLEARGGHKRLTLSNASHVDTELVFFATGRRANLRGLGLEAVGVHTNAHGAIAVDADLATNVPHIYAIGDVTDRLNLTPVAIAEGHNLADRLFGKHAARTWSFQAVPTAVFSTPPLATAGLTEAEAAQHGPHDIYLTRFTPMRHTMSRRNRRTMMKLVVEQTTQRVVGAHMLGEDSPELIQGLAVAMTAGATKTDFDRTVGIHPTSAEEFVTLRTRTRVAGGG